MVINGGSIPPLQHRSFDTGLVLKYLDPTYYLKIEPESSVVIKKNLTVLAGIINSDFRGEIMVTLYNLSPINEVHIKTGDVLAQAFVHYSLRPELTLYTEKDSSLIPGLNNSDYDADSSGSCETKKYEQPPNVLESPNLGEINPVYPPTGLKTGRSNPVGWLLNQRLTNERPRDPRVSPARRKPPNGWPDYNTDKTTQDYSPQSPDSETNDDRQSPEGGRSWMEIKRKRLKNATHTKLLPKIMDEPEDWDEDEKVVKMEDHN